MLKKIVFVFIVFCFFFSSNVGAIDQSVFQELNFKVGHSGDSEIQKAFQLLVDRGILVQEKQAKSISFPPRGDCFVSFGQGLLQSGLLKDLSERRIPKEVLEISLLLQDNFILIKGRLDGPAFINPRFEAKVNVKYVKENMFSVWIASLKVAGFSVSWFSNLAANYILDAMKRAFPSTNQAQCYKGPVQQGAIVINMTINPEGFVSGIGKKAYLSNIGINNGEFWFSFTTPQK